MAHYIGPEVTSGAVPEVHAGLSYKFAQFTLPQTASASNTIDIAVLPGGARLHHATMSIDNNDLVTTGGPSTVWLDIVTGGTTMGLAVQSASANLAIYNYNPNDLGLAYKATSSSHLRVHLSCAATGTGTGTTIFSVAFSYDCTEDPSQ